MLAKSAADVVAGCILIRTDPIISTKSLFFCSMLTFLAFPSASFPSKQLASCIFKYLSIHFQAHRFKAKLGPCYVAIPFPDAGKPAGRWDSGQDSNSMEAQSGGFPAQCASIVAWSCATLLESQRSVFFF